MFDLREFEDNLELKPIVDKLNKLLTKNKEQKLAKIIEELIFLLDQPEQRVPITYILSILAENNINLISERTLEAVESFLDSDEEKLRLNSVLILGFVMLEGNNFGNTHFHTLSTFLNDSSEDIRSNILDSLSMERNLDNIISLLTFLEYCDELNFDQLYRLREISMTLISLYFSDKKSEISSILLSLISRFFLELKESNLRSLKSKDLLALLEAQFIMKKSEFIKSSESTDKPINDYLKELKKSGLKEKKIFFYTKSKGNPTRVYELERSNLISFFNEELKISHERIKQKFSPIIEDDKELRIFLQTLVHLGKLNGYYSDLGFFYPTHHVKRNLMDDLTQNGLMNLKRYNHLPPDLIEEIIKDIKSSLRDILLLGKNKNVYYSLKRIQAQINIEAAKTSVIDLKSYRDRLNEEDFILLIKNLPNEYLSNYHKGTQWLTNLGTLRISGEIQKSKVIGYFNLAKISKKLKIQEIFLFDVFDYTVDNRSGIWDKNNVIFYYSKYVNKKIEDINSATNQADKLNLIDLLANQLDIDKTHIMAKIDENLQSIATEIKQKDQIIISEYIEKTGMNSEAFLKFIADLGIKYFKKADVLIFNSQKIEEAMNNIKYSLLDKSKSLDYINLGTFDITSALIEDLIKNLLSDGKLRGIFYEFEGKILFYTERGIRSLMLEDSFMFSFRDLFYGKELDENEISLMKEIFDDLVKTKRLKGTFDADSLTFSSDDVLFAKDYNTVLSEFEKTIKNYTQIFESGFQKIRKTLIKRGETIFPQEIKNIQEIIDKINSKYVQWFRGLEAFIKRTNKKLLSDQGVSVKQYKNIFTVKEKDEIMSFEDDPEVFELMNIFKSWVKLFNKLEVKYPNVLFYQKRLINNPDDKESEKKLNDLLEELSLITT
ncbi:MAG: hypothetical protein ACXAES_01600 [Promethearchaeota archaeon]|jgi:hypothetical protein